MTSFFAVTSDALLHVGPELITQGELLERLCKKGVAFSHRFLYSKIAKMTCEDISGDGYTSSIYRIVLEMTDKKEPISFIFKVFSFLKLTHFITEFIGISIDDMPAEQRADMAQKCAAAHDAECTFYELFSINDSCTLPLAKIYSIEKVTFDEKQIPHGFILMEDLSIIGCCKNIADGLNEAQMRAVVNALTCFHAQLLCDDSPEKWRKAITKEYFLGQKLDEQIGSFMRKITPLHDTNLPLLVCHGDSWTNNIMWKRGPDGKAGDELLAIVDWQLIHLGNLMGDFARLLVSSCESDVRASVEKWLLPYYLEKLNKLVKPYNIPFDLNLKKLQKAYNFAKIGQAAIAPTFMGPIHQAFAAKSTDPKIVEWQTRRMLTRTFDAINEAKQILVSSASEWLAENDS